MYTEVQMHQLERRHRREVERLSHQVAVLWTVLVGVALAVALFV